MYALTTDKMDMIGMASVKLYGEGQTYRERGYMQRQAEGFWPDPKTSNIPHQVKPVKDRADFMSDISVKQDR